MPPAGTSCMAGPLRRIEYWAPAVTWHKEHWMFWAPEEGQPRSLLIERLTIAHYQLNKDFSSPSEQLCSAGGGCVAGHRWLYGLLLVPGASEGGRAR